MPIASVVFNLIEIRHSRANGKIRRIQRVECDYVAWIKSIGPNPYWRLRKAERDELIADCSSTIRKFEVSRPSDASRGARNGRQWRAFANSPSVSTFRDSARRLGSIATAKGPYYEFESSSLRQPSVGHHTTSEVLAAQVCRAQEENHGFD
jgi:hypothetical protein